MLSRRAGRGWLLHRAVEHAGRCIALARPCEAAPRLQSAHHSSNSPTTTTREAYSDQQERAAHLRRALPRAPPAIPACRTGSLGRDVRLAPTHTAEGATAPLAEGEPQQARTIVRLSTSTAPGCMVTARREPTGAPSARLAAAHPRHAPPQTHRAPPRCPRHRTPAPATTRVASASATTRASRPSTSSDSLAASACVQSEAACSRQDRRSHRGDRHVAYSEPQGNRQVCRRANPTAPSHPSWSRGESGKP